MRVLPSGLTLHCDYRQKRGQPPGVAPSPSSTWTWVTLTQTTHPLGESRPLALVQGYCSMLMKPMKLVSWDTQRQQVQQTLVLRIDNL